MDDRQKQKWDPRSPVQPDRSPAPYFIVAAFAAMLVWTAQQYWITDSQTGSDRRYQLTTPAPSPRPATRAEGDVRTLFSADDYPASAQRNGEEGTVQARLIVDPDGHVSRCSIVRSSGHASLDEATCDILRRRARFVPARDVDGNPTSDAVVTPPVAWRLEG